MILIAALSADPFPLASWADSLLAAAEGWPEIAILGSQAAELGRKINERYFEPLILF